MKSKYLILIYLLSIINLIAQIENTCLQIQNITGERVTLSGPEQIIESAHFIVHYTQSGADACLTEYAERASQYAEESYNIQCNVLGWQIPPGDGAAGGSLNKYDIYIKSIGDYGFVTPEVPDGWTNNWATSFIQIMNTLDSNKLKITVAHEFNHVIQYGYSLKLEGFWFHENTATWVEDLVYDEPDLYLRWFDDIPNAIETPDFGLNDTFEANLIYAGLWPRLMAEWINQDIVKEIWERMGTSPGTSILEDTDFILQNYGKTLDEAIVEYAVWRYFTGSRNDNQHFSNAADLPTAPLEQEFFSLPESRTVEINRKGIGGVKYYSFINPYDNILLSFDGLVNDEWVGGIIEDKSPQQSVTRIIDQTGEIIANSASSNRVIFLPIKKAQGNSATSHFSAENYSVSIITFSNLINQNKAGGSLLLDGVDEIQSGDSRVLGEQTTHEVETLNERFDNAKHNNWNNSNSRYFLSNDFTAEDGNDQSANFIGLQPATISLKVDGIAIESPDDEIKFNDPWYVKSDGTQSGMNDFIEFDAPYEPTGKEGETNGGVFLDQNPSYDPLLPGYKVSISPTQTINYNNRNHKIYFNNWSHNGKADFQDAELATTPVVFTDGGAEVYANHKGSLLSSTDVALRGASQRKIARTSDGSYHIVYESMGRVWYEVNISNGWYFISPIYDDEPASPLSSSNAKHPSIAVNGNNSLVVYQENVNGQSDIVIKYFQSNFTDSEKRISTSESYTLDLTPVISFSKSDEFMVVWKGSAGLKYRVYPIAGNQIGNSIDNDIIPNTTSFSKNPSLAGKYTDGLSSTQYHITWQDGTSSIKYVMYYNGGGQKFFNTITVSSSSGYDKHWNPEVVVADDKVYVGWVGQRYESDQQEPPPPIWKTNAFGGGGSLGEWKERGLLKKYENGSWSGILKALGSDVDDIALNTTGGSVVFAYYTESNGLLGETSYTKGVYSADNLNTIFPISNGGKSFMLSNGVTVSSMKWFDVAIGSQLNPVEPPYALRNGNISINPSKVGTNNYALNGREGITQRDSIQFYFTFGEIIVDGIQIGFVDMPDSMKEIKNTNQLNKYLVSEPFTLNDNSEFTYGIMCGVADSSDVEIALKKNEFINFKVELIDGQSSHVLGIYDNVTFTADSINYYSNKNYLVNTNGVGNKTVRLRMQIKDNFKQSYSLGNLLVEDSLMYKKGYHELHYKGELLIKEYNLVQNYPNPFNPSTVIRYQLPKAGNVKLIVYDILGKEVAKLIDEFQNDGRYEVKFDASNLSSGVYIYRLEANDFVDSKKMLLVK